jgi:hypothetical protein
MKWLRRWRRSATFWRVAALILVGLPQLAGRPLPDLGPDSADPGVVTSQATVVIGGSRPPGEEFIGYLTGSGALLLLLAVVCALPRGRARRVVPWVAGIVAALGLGIGYVAMSGIDHNETAGAGLGGLLFLSPCYLLAAAALVLSERAARRAH